MYQYVCAQKRCGYSQYLAVSIVTRFRQDSITHVRHFVTQYVYRFYLTKGEGGRKGEISGRRKDK
jgi:hypothetical protein